MVVEGGAAVTVYGQPGCVQCAATYRALDQVGVAFVRVDVSVDEIARQYVQALGHQQAPVVVTAAGEHWAGYRPDRLRDLAKLGSLL